jgi:hypothetical protein
MQSMSATSIWGRLQLAAALVIFSLAATTLAACGGSSNGSSPDATATPPAAVATRPPASTPLARVPTPRAAAPNAPRPPGGAGAATKPRVRAAFAQFTSCMRQNGLDIPEPGAKPGASRKPLDTASPRFKAALAKCRSILTAALRTASAAGHAAGGKG